MVKDQLNHILDELAARGPLAGLGFMNMDPTLMLSTTLTYIIALISLQSVFNPNIQASKAAKNSNEHKRKRERCRHISIISVIFFFCLLPVYKALQARYTHWEDLENDPRWNVSKLHGGGSGFSEGMGPDPVIRRGGSEFGFSEGSNIYFFSNQRI